MVDIVVPTRGRGALIDTTLSSIRQSTHTNFTLWVIDQSDDDATAQAVAPHLRADCRVRYVRSRGRGISIARNQGVALGVAPYILFTDDDCMVEPGWISAMLQELAQDGTWATFGRVLPSAERSNDAASSALLALPIAIKTSPHRAVYKGNRFNLGFGHGACMGVRRSCYEQIHGFDELLGTGAPLHSWEDRDLGYRVLRRGGQIVYTPGSLVYHRQWRSWREVRRTYRSYAIGMGAATAKYLRCGDWGGCYLLGEWLLDQGLRQIISGALKWRSWQKVLIGVFQFVYPWVGLAQGLCYPIDRQRMLYEPPDQAAVC
ncbi:MAG: glycosyltransferase [Roseiflexaceae bacterium]